MSIYELLSYMRFNTMQAETSYPAVIGRILEFKRKELNLDQGDIAKQLGITQSAWSRIERGQSGISMEHLIKVSEILNTKPFEIIQAADEASEKLKSDGVKVHPNVITNSDNIIAVLGLAALSMMILAILNKK